MKKLGFLLAAMFLTAFAFTQTASAINVTVPAAPGTGYILTSTTTGAYVYVSGNGASGNCVKWGANNSLVDVGAPCGSGGSASSTLLIDNNTFSGNNIFTNGLMALASSTIGNGTQTGGLTISGSATTTFPLYVHATSATNNSFVDVATLDAGTSGAVNGFGPSLLFSDLPSNGTTNMARIAAVYDNDYSDLTFSVSPYNTAGNTTLAEAMRILYNGNVGIGTTTPGSILSIGNTNGINISATATSTWGFGHNILSGCYAINGTCLSSGGSGTVTSVGLSSTNSTLTIGSTPVTTAPLDANLRHK